MLKEQLACPRPAKEITLKEAIQTVLADGHPKTLKEIADGVLAAVYNTRSQTDGNIVRLQLYRLDDDGQIMVHEDGRISLRRVLRAAGVSAAQLAIRLHSL